jgi:hypothetical protein
VRERSNITDPMDEPFAEIGEHLGVNFSPSVIGVAGRAYLLDTESGDYWRQGVSVLQQRNTTNNRDLLLMPQDVWRFMYESWHQGAGQSSLDRDDSLPHRYAESFGVDVWTKYRLSLLHHTDQITYATGPKPTFLNVHRNDLVIASGTTLTWWRPAPAIPPGVDLEVGTTDIIDTTYDGDAVITLHADGSIFKSTDETTTAEYVYTFPTPTKPAGAPDDWTPPPAPDKAEATFVAYVKDYLLVGIGNRLYNITGPEAVLVYTSPVTGFTWKGAAEGNNAIYLIGGASDKHVVHRVNVKQDGTGLNPAIVAAGLPDGEIGYSIGAYLGYVFIGTDTGVRMATPAGQEGDLVLGAMIPNESPVLGFEGQDRFVWYTNSTQKSRFGERQEDFPPGPVPGLSRMDLTTFTVSESTPAYAQDIFADASSGVVRSVVTWNNLRAFSIDGVGVFVENSTELVRQGWVTHGDISFGVEDLKTGLYAQFKWLPLKGGSVEMLAAYDSNLYVSLSEKEDRESIRSGNISMSGQQFSRISVGLVLRSDKADNSIGPTITRWEIRAVPVKGLASRWSLPIINHDEVAIAGVPENRDVNAELQRLLKIVQAGAVFTLQEGGIAYQVYPKDYKWTPQKLSSNGRGWQGVFQLVCEEIK